MNLLFLKEIPNLMGVLHIDQVLTIPFYDASVKSEKHEISMHAKMAKN